jgi:hypothetical protein
MQPRSEAATEAESRAVARPDGAPLRAVELLVVAAVWAFY